MNNPRPLPVLRQLRTIFGPGTVGGLTDAALLDRFTTGPRESSEAAFATLVERHGPMVLRVCRSVLRDSHDVNDAFQAVFLILARRAHSLWIRDSLGPWLHGVALRVTAKAKVAAARRKVHELRAVDLQREESDAPMIEPDLAATLHEELEKLPWKYKAPTVLFYLEGHSQERTAEVLGWPIGTVRGRLSRARDLLRDRLTRRGLAPTTAFVAGLLSAENASAVSVPESLIRASISLAAERSAGVATASVARLASTSSTASRLKSVALAVASLLVSVGAYQAFQPKPAGIQPAAQADAEVPDAWPSDTDIRGKVVDHQGNPVAGASVVMLGHERMIVRVTGHENESQIRVDVSDHRPDDLVKTDEQGRFVTRRVGSPADRIAVVSGRLFLWEVTRKESASNDLLIKLPEPVALTLRSAFPGKPARTEFVVEGRPLGRSDRESDLIYYRDLKVSNPGERLVRSLPPAQYVVERIDFTPNGRASILTTPCDRTLVRIEPGRSAVLSFDRKQGRVVQGRVLGLGSLKFRFAAVTVSYAGPEELDGPGGKKFRQFTHHDVIPIESDGRFTTSKLPPNRYEFRFAGVLASTPSEYGAYDFDGAATVDVSEAGEIKPVEIVAKRTSSTSAKLVKPADPSIPWLEVTAKDEAGAAVRDFSIRIHSPSSRLHEAAGVDGKAVITTEGLKEWQGGELIITAPGFASSLRELGPIKGFRSVDVTMKKGKPIRLRVSDASGKPIPSSVMPMPQVYGSKQRADAWTILSYKDPETRAQQVLISEFLGIVREPDGGFSFRLSDESPDLLYFGFSRPDVVWFYEHGPVRVKDLPGGVWDVVLPQPARLDIGLNPKPGGVAESPFAAVNVMLLPVLAGQTPVLETARFDPSRGRTTFDRIGPGSYQVHIETIPARAPANPANRDAHPGVFRELRRIDVKAGERLSINFDPPAFAPELARGKLSATLDVSKGAGSDYRVAYLLPHRGAVPVAEGKVPADGTIRLDGLATSVETPLGGYYSVEVGGHYLGKFSLKDGAEPRTFRFRMPPTVGDPAPLDEALDLETGKPVRISDFRGKFVFVEFWATWCGPCREPLEKLDDLAKRRGSAWRDDVAFLAVGIDNEREPLVRRSSPDGARRLWSPEAHPEGVSSAHAAFAVTGVPTAFLIDREGRIVWRGHPSSIALEAKLGELLGKSGMVPAR